MDDYNLLRAEYLASKCSIRALAQKYGISEYTLKRRAEIEQWTTLRKQFHEKLVSETIKKTAKSAASREANHLSRLIKATTRAIDVAMGAFDDKQQFHRFLVKDSGKDAEVQEKVFNKLDTKALRELTAALKNLTALQREFYDLPTPAETRSLQLANEKLALERQKLEAGQSGAELEVRFSEDADALSQ